MFGCMTPATVPANDPQLEHFFASNCVNCHGPEEQNGDVRLDLSFNNLTNDLELLDKITGVLEAGEMPPKGETQPDGKSIAEVIQTLQKHLAAIQPANPLKRLTRFEYTHTIHDLFDIEFDFSGLLPPDHVENGFDKFGEAHLMSPHQITAYLNTARFIAQRVLPDHEPKTRVWEFDAQHFHGSKNFATGGGGDYRDGDDYVLTGFRPYRSNLHWSIDSQKHDQFVIPEFGVYRLEVAAHSVDSNQGEVIGINLGDGRHPTSFRLIKRIALANGSKGFSIELTLRAGDQLAFTFDSARVPGRSLANKPHTGPAMHFSKVKVTGPLIDQWPTVAMERLLPNSDMKPGELVDHITLLLTKRPMSSEDRRGFVEIARKQLKSGASMKATARSVLTAVLTSPHFIYKAESPELTNVEHAYRLSYFLWNSVPDETLLESAMSGDLAKDPAIQVERMLLDPRMERFVDDFTRQWLQLDKVDDFGPDVRVFKDVRRMTVDSMAREGQEFFRHVLENDLSLKNFIDSDFVMANDRLARFYKLPPVDGDDFVPVKLPADSERGGLVAQAGFLKLTSTDFATSPIHRGAWILKNLYNERIEPPADVLINEPDIRGTKTIREAILKHQQLESCARCHSRIDPLGFALEYYDPVGRKRSEYRHVTEIVPEDAQTTFTKKIKFTSSPIDAAMTLANGHEVRDMVSLKAALMADQELILKGIIRKLISYAHGRELTRADRKHVDDIYKTIAPGEYSLREAIHAIVAHEAFGRR
ncbi:MAG: hypothetical protein CMJ82_12920 [Planctomycetaceae bacterium]|nr:hypothetical protein [Planctomycetaceae bacterium]